MATTNLQSKTLGNAILQSGTGTPDHTAPIGSLYMNETTGVLYQNYDGATGWVSMNRIAYGRMYFNTNVTALTGIVQNTWYKMTSLTWVTGLKNGIDVVSARLKVINNPGTYMCYGIATVQYVAATANYEAGIILNNAASPPTGFQNGGTVLSTATTSNIAIAGAMVLANNDTIELAVRNISNTQNILVKHASIFIERIGD